MSHKHEWVNLDTGCHTNNIEKIWCDMKDAYRKYGGLRKANYAVYIAQWCFRHNHIRYAPVINQFLIFCKAIAKYSPLAANIDA